MPKVTLSPKCSATNKKTGERCQNPPFMGLIEPERFCPQHIDQDPETPFCHCASKQGCKEVVLKRFGVCYKHFDLYLAGIGNQELEQRLWENLNFLNPLISSMFSQMPSVRTDKTIYHRIYKSLRKYQSMRLQILEKSKQRSLERMILQRTQIGCSLSPRETELKNQLSKTEASVSPQSIESWSSENFLSESPDPPERTFQTNCLTESSMFENGFFSNSELDLQQYVNSILACSTNDQV